MVAKAYRVRRHLLATSQVYVMEGIVDTHCAAVTQTVTAIRKAPHRAKRCRFFGRLPRRSDEYVLF